MSKRSRDPLDDPKSGPSKNQLRGLSYVGQKPAFLQNALAALQGGTRKQQPQFDSNGRPIIPTRPGGEEGSAGEEESEDDQDEWDLGGGDEAPTVVVLKEGKHLDKNEVDRLRAQGESRENEALCSPATDELYCSSSSQGLQSPNLRPQKSQPSRKGLYHSHPERSRNRKMEPDRVKVGTTSSNEARVKQKRSNKRRKKKL